MTSILSRDSALWRRPQTTPLALNLVVATYLMVVSNGGFWAAASTLVKGAPLDVIGIGLAVWSVTFFTLSLVSLPWLHRPFLAVLILVAAGAAYYQKTLGVLIDRDMIRNIMETTVTELKHLITADYLRHMALTGVLPAALLFWPRVKWPPLRHLVWRWPVSIAAGFALTVAFLMTDFKAYSAVIREHKEMMGAYQPGATIAALYKYGKDQMRGAQVAAKPLGTDAKKGPHLSAADKPALLILFVGETARAQNFGLNGYARDTTPELRKRDVINFSQASSCGTSTAVSVPCMFSPFARDDYSRPKYLGSENLLDVLAHAGVKADWWDNNTGDQQVAARTGWQRVDAKFDPASCAEGECTDDAFFKVIDTTIKGMTEDTVLVLHMIGSHGPAYYLRYPKAAAVFTPDCRTAQFSDCTPEEIVNAYDNSILQTDRVVAHAIDMAEAAPNVLPAVLFMSDHGELLGEGGLYLHAAPAFMAPEVQTRVPFVLWLSERFAGAMGIDKACLAAKGADAVSHDNLFHSVLGLMDIQTGVRSDDLDLVASCRKTEAM